MSSFVVRRWWPERVTPVELWDLPIDGVLLYRRVGAERVAELRRRGMTEGAIDRELAESLAAALAVLRAKDDHALEEVVISGGLAQRAGLLDALRSLAKVEVRFQAGSPGSSQLMIELGQTALKLAHGSQSRRIPRPLELLPIARTEEGPASAELRREQGHRLLVHLASVVAAFARGINPDAGHGIDLALPCAIDASGGFGPCTYAGLDSDWVDRFIARTLAAIPAEHPWVQRELEVRLLNDAELAGHRARESGGRKSGLALTLGFGPGGAWFETPSPRGA